MSVVAVVLFGAFLFFDHEAHGRQVFPYPISEYNETGKFSKERLPQSGGNQQFWSLTKDRYSDQIMPTDDASRVNRWELYVVNGRFLGSKARLNTWAIPQVQADQISSLAIRVVGGGPFQNLNVIQAGWHVYPQKYQDTHSHFFISWISDKYQGCYNLDCPGFVLNTSSGISPGMALPRVSSFNGDQYYLTISIEKHNKQGDWLLNVAMDGDKIVNVGFWPKSLFTSLIFHGSQFTYGGGTTSAPNEPSPPMGSGQQPAGAKDGKAATIKGIQLRGEDGKYFTPAINSFRRAPLDDSSCYGLSEISKEDDGDKFFVGGPGGCK